jgi:transposase-like protein
MKNIFIAYISIIRDNAKFNTIDTHDLCPVDTMETLQTNETALKCLSAKLGGKIDRVIALVSNSADGNAVNNEIVNKAAKADGMESYTSYGYFENVCCKGIADEIIPIRTETDDGKERSSAAILSDICNKIEDDDAVYIDTTGGSREVLNLIRLLSKMLGYKKISNPCSFYTSILGNDKVIKDTSEFTRMMNMADGVNEFVTTGRSVQLQNCFKENGVYRSDVPQEIIDLLEVMSKFTDRIQLCNVQELDTILADLKTAIDNISNVCESERIEFVILKNLLPVIENKFFGNSSDSVTDYVRIIEWCVDNGLIQQALTVFTEKLPVYLFKSGMISAADEGRIREEISTINGGLKSADKETDYFYMNLMGYSGKCRWWYKDASFEHFKKYISTGKNSTENIVRYKEDGLEELEKKFREFKDRTDETEGENFQSKTEALKKILKKSDKSDVLYKIARFASANVSESAEKTEKYASYAEMCADVGRRWKEIYEMAGCPTNNFSAKFDTADIFGTSKKPKQNLENYNIRIPHKKLSDIMYGYLCIKSTRNRINHAGSDETLNKKQMKILEQHGYKNELSTKSVAGNIRHALDAVKKAEETKA